MFMVDYFAKLHSYLVYFTKQVNYSFCSVTKYYINLKYFAPLAKMSIALDDFADLWKVFIKRFTYKDY